MSYSLSQPLHPALPPLHPSLTLGVSKSLVHKMALWLVALTILSGAFVFAEPAPVDVLTVALMIGLPVIGLTRFNDGLKIFMAIWFVIGGCHVAAVMITNYTGDSFIHVAVSLYLFAAAVVFAAFIARRPGAHTELVLNAYYGAALIAALAAVAGYFSLVPGANELFTKYGRASGPFKDPNVFGAFLVPATVFALHKILNSTGWQRTVMFASLGLFLFATLIGFSRGAWAATSIALTVYLALSFLTAKYYRQQVQMAAMVLIGGIVLAFALMVISQSDAVGDLLQERAQLTQAYDVGHEGRFGGQRKAIDLIASNPFGIGALDFSQIYHSEEVHNVYLTMFLKAGWLGGGLFLVLMMATLLLGLRHAFRRTKTQPLYIVAYASLAALILEGFLIDNDHWRHFYLLLAIVWGLMLSDVRIARAPRIIADISAQRMQLAGLTHAPARALQPVRTVQPTRPARLKSRAAGPNAAFYDVRGYSAYAHRPPRIIKTIH